MNRRGALSLLRFQMPCDGTHGKAGYGGEMGILGAESIGKRFCIGVGGTAR